MYRILVGKLFGNGPFDGPRRRCEDTTNVYLKEIYCQKSEVDGFRVVEPSNSSTLVLVALIFNRMNPMLWYTEVGEGGVGDSH